MQSRLFKNPNFPSLLWIGKNLEIYTAPDQHFKIQMLNLWMSWENLCPNLTFTVENKMGNSHKRGWSHFKLNLNDWDIPFPNILRICQWIGKNIFHWGKWNEPIKLIKKYVRSEIKIQILVAAKRLWGHSKSRLCLLKTSNFQPIPPCSSLSILHVGCLWIFLNEKLRSEKREKNYFFVNST